MFGSPLALEELTFESVESIRRCEEPKGPTIANDDASLACHCDKPWPNFNNVVVEHKKSHLPPAHRKVSICAGAHEDACGALALVTRRAICPSNPRPEPKSSGR